MSSKDFNENIKILFCIKLYSIVGRIFLDRFHDSHDFIKIPKSIFMKK